jgi:hypothetical protein
MPELSPERKPNPEPLTSGDSDFESATGSPAPEPTRNFIDTIEGGPQVETKQTWTKQVELIEGGPQIDFEEEETHKQLVESSYFTEPRPNQPYSPIENLFTNIRNFDWPLPINTITMAQPVAGPKELNLNKPEAFDVTTSNYMLYRACTRVRYWARYNSQQSSSESTTFPKIRSSRVWWASQRVPLAKEVLS